MTNGKEMKNRIKKERNDPVHNANRVYRQKKDLSHKQSGHFSHSYSFGILNWKEYEINNIASKTSELPSKGRPQAVINNMKRDDKIRRYMDNIAE